MAARDRVFTLYLTPRGIDSKVLLDGIDLSDLLRGIVIRSDVEHGTSIELIPATGRTVVDLQLVLPEAHVTICADQADPRPDDH